MFQKTVLIAGFIMLFLTGFKANTPTVTETDKDKTANDLNFERLFYLIDKNNFEAPKLKTYKKALRGYFEYKSKNQIQGNMIVIVDFSIPSTQKRLWVIDFAANKILYNCLVTHGKGTGDAIAYSFSNELHSNKSSLGFYATAETYSGKHGLSLKLDGLQYGLNHKARERGIVMHGADYASDLFIKKHGFLGRSLGCPAIPLVFHKEIIPRIKNKNCLFIYHPILDL
jgi:hypothetical protein